jgi:hypothetical protein
MILYIQMLFFSVCVLLLNFCKNLREERERGESTNKLDAGTEAVFLFSVSSQFFFIYNKRKKKTSSNPKKRLRRDLFFEII